MPKTKTTDKKEEKKIKGVTEEPEKIIEIAETEEVLDEELIPGEISEDDPEEDDAGLDEEEVDPFKDKWEE